MRLLAARLDLPEPRSKESLMPRRRCSGERHLLAVAEVTGESCEGGLQPAQPVALHRAGGVQDVHGPRRAAQFVLVGVEQPVGDRAAAGEGQFAAAGGVEAGRGRYGGDDRAAVRPVGDQPLDRLGAQGVGDALDVLAGRRVGRGEGGERVARAFTTSGSAKNSAFSDPITIRTVFVAVLLSSSLRPATTATTTPAVSSTARTIPAMRLTGGACSRNPAFPGGPGNEG
ncbi:hypothetical protein ASD48_12330 [Streptomyces sp. Root1310]|nr:hypothetical protein ASD48_12330 [Streptomyces sp. Root1310]